MLIGVGAVFDFHAGAVRPIRKFCIAKESGAQGVEVRGMGSREFPYVHDARGIVLATKRYDSSEPVNVGAGQRIRIRDLAALIAKLTGFEGAILWDTTRPDGQPRRMLDTSRAAQGLGFRAEVGLEEGLERTIDWRVLERG